MPMRILRTMLNQWAVYWAPAGTDQFGNPKYAAPVNLKVRWEDTTEVYKNPTGQEVRSRAKVYTASDVLEKGVLWLGPNDGITADPLATLTTDQKAKPFTNNRAWAIGSFLKMPIMNPKTSADFMRVAYL